MNNANKLHRDKNKINVATLINFITSKKQETNYRSLGMVWTVVYFQLNLKNDEYQSKHALTLNPLYHSLMVVSSYDVWVLRKSISSLVSLSLLTKQPIVTSATIETFN